MHFPFTVDHCHLVKAHFTGAAGVKRRLRMFAHKCVQLFVSLTRDAGTDLSSTEFIQRRLVDDFPRDTNRIAELLPVLFC